MEIIVIKKKPSKRNPIARALRTPLYRKRVVESKMTYNRDKLKSREKCLDD